MKKLYILLLLLIAGMGAVSLLSELGSKRQEVVVKGDYHPGDIIFQTSESRQSLAIQMATHSPYSHCGILFQREGEWWVYEAVQPVGICPLEDWIHRGKEGRYVIKRLKNQAISLPQMDSLLTIAVAFNGRDYDPWFEWSDERIYCSELVWKLYYRGLGLRIGKLQTLGSLDLSAPQVQEIMYERYGNKLPLNDSLITPVAIFKSPLLKTVFANGKWLN